MYTLGIKIAKRNLRKEIEKRIRVRINIIATIAFVLILAIGFVMTFSGKFKLGYWESATICALFIFFYLLFMVSMNYMHLKSRYRENKNYLNTLKLNSMDLVFEKDLNLGITDCNLAFEKFFGLSRKEILGKNLFKLMDEKNLELIKESDKKIIDTKESVKFVMSATDKNGDEVVFDIIKSPLFDDKNEIVGIVGTCRDITSQVRWEKDRRTFNETLVHDIKTPIVAQTKILEILLEEKVGKLNDEQKELIKHTISSNTFAKEMVLAMLSTYKFSNNGYNFTPAKFEIIQFVQYLIDDLKPASYTKNLKIELENKELKDTFIIADNVSLHRIMLNLVFNAISYSAENSTISVVLSSDNNKFIFKTVNQAPKTDITKENLLSMFDKYSFGKKQNRQVGSGIGLFLTKCIISHYDGQIVYDVIKDDIDYDEYVLGFEIPLDNSQIENKLFKFDY